MKRAGVRGLFLSWKSRLRSEALCSRLTGVCWSKLDAERVQSVEGVLYDVLLVFSVGWPFPASARGVARDVGKRLRLASWAFGPTGQRSGRRILDGCCKFDAQGLRQNNRHRWRTQNATGHASSCSHELCGEVNEGGSIHLSLVVLPDRHRLPTRSAHDTHRPGTNKRQGFYADAQSYLRHTCLKDLFDITIRDILERLIHRGSDKKIAVRSGNESRCQTQGQQQSPGRISDFDFELCSRLFSNDAWNAESWRSTQTQEPKYADIGRERNNHSCRTAVLSTKGQPFGTRSNTL